MVFQRILYWVLCKSEYSSSNADCFVKGMDDISENYKSTSYTEKANCEKKTVSCNTDDRASANFRYWGVLIQLKATWNWLITIHSVNHRVETFHILEFKKVEDFSNSNYYFLCNNGKLKERVTTSAEASGIVCHISLRIHGNRFVRHCVKGFKNWIES